MADESRQRRDRVRERLRGYGRLMTPSAGPMIIHLQRERGLAHRTIILSHRQLRWLRAGLLALGLVIVTGSASWIYLATQASRVPFLAKRVTNLQRDARKLDTLQFKLTELEQRYEQVQRMLGVKHKDQTVTDSAIPGPNAR